MKHSYEPLPVPRKISARKLLDKFGRPNKPVLTWRGAARVRLAPQRQLRWMMGLTAAVASAALVAVGGYLALAFFDDGPAATAQSATPDASAAASAASAAPASEPTVPPSMAMHAYGDRRLTGLARIGKSPKGNVRLRLAVRVPHRWEAWLSDGPGKAGTQLGSGVAGTTTMANTAFSFRRFLSYRFIEVYVTLPHRRKQTKRLAMRIRTDALHRRFM